MLVKGGEAALKLLAQQDLAAPREPQAMLDLVEAHMRAQGWHVVAQAPDLATRLEHARIVRMVRKKGYRAAHTSLDDPLAEAVVEAGAGEILLTSWDRDGTRAGYDLALLQAISQAVNVPIIASGGAHTPHHLLESIQAGASGYLVKPFEIEVFKRTLNRILGEVSK